MEGGNVKKVSNGDSIGKILLNFQKINESDIERIIDLQEKEGLYFGEAAIKLGLADKEDVDLAVAYQFAYPYLSRNQNTLSREIIAAYTPLAPRVEALRSVRTALLLSGAGKSLKSICVVGCSEGDGKTFMGVNLAVLFAQLGQKTLLVDFNLRTPKIHSLFQLKNSHGISTLLIDRSTVDEAIQPTPFEKLNILPSGPPPPNPQELIARKASQIIRTLKETYEICIVNTTSLDRADDASLLSTFVDGVFIVALQGKTRKNELERAMRLLEGAEAKILGAVLNQK